MAPGSGGGEAQVWKEVVAKITGGWRTLKAALDIPFLDFPQTLSYLLKGWHTRSKPLPEPSWPHWDTTKEKRQEQPGPGSLRYWG